MNPNETTYSEALFVSTLALLSYIIKYKDMSGVVMHIVSMLPLVVYPNRFSIQKIKPHTYILIFISWFMYRRK